MKTGCTFLLILMHFTMHAQLSKQRVLIGDTLSYSFVTEGSSELIRSSVNEQDLSWQIIKSDTLSNNSIKQFNSIQPWVYGTYTFVKDSVHRDTFEVKQLQPNQLFVDTPIVDLNKDIKDVVGYQEKRNYKTIILFASIAFILLSALLYLFTKIVQSDKRKLSPLQYSLQLLKNTSTTDVADKVQEAIKQYLQNRLAIPALAIPYQELQPAIDAHRITKHYSTDLSYLLQQTDLIKYAQKPVNESQHQELIRLSIAIINKMEANKVAELEQQKQARKKSGR